ncbi:hypothetical protein BDQ17DRAFT_1325787 [Cyathus striatus]|nr:hypothetical protein BDQ17DRAFT_1325787 [Cyathus striatus]
MSSLSVEKKQRRKAPSILPSSYVANVQGGVSTQNSHIADVLGMSAKTSYIPNVQGVDPKHTYYSPPLTQTSHIGNFKGVTYSTQNVPGVPTQIGHILKIPTEQDRPLYYHAPTDTQCRPCPGHKIPERESLQIHAKRRDFSEVPVSATRVLGGTAGRLYSGEFLSYLRDPPDIPYGLCRMMQIKAMEDERKNGCIPVLPSNPVIPNPIIISDRSEDNLASDSPVQAESVMELPLDVLLQLIRDDICEEVDVLKSESNVHKEDVLKRFHELQKNLINMLDEKVGNVKGHILRVHRPNAIMHNLRVVQAKVSKDQDMITYVFAEVPNKDLKFPSEHGLSPLRTASDISDLENNVELLRKYYAFYTGTKEFFGSKDGLQMSDNDLCKEAYEHICGSKTAALQWVTAAGDPGDKIRTVFYLNWVK